MDDEKERLKAQLKSLAKLSDMLREQTALLTQENPEITDVVQAVFDQVVDSLTYWCNYDRAIDNAGTAHDMQLCMDEYKEVLEGIYRELTGQEYVPQIVRLTQWRRKSSE